MVVMRKPEVKSKSRMPVIVAIAEASASAISVKHDNPTSVEHYNPTSVEHYNPTPVENYNPNYYGNDVKLNERKSYSSEITKKKRNILITLPVTLGFIYIMYMLKKKYVENNEVGYVKEIEEMLNDIMKYEKDFIKTVQRFSENNNSTSNIDDVMKIVSKKMLDALKKVEKLREKQMDYNKYIQEEMDNLTREVDKKNQEMINFNCTYELLKISVLIQVVATFCQKQLKENKLEFKVVGDCRNMFSRMNQHIRACYRILNQDKKLENTKKDFYKKFKENSMKEEYPELMSYLEKNDSILYVDKKTVPTTVSDVSLLE